MIGWRSALPALAVLQLLFGACAEPPLDVLLITLDTTRADHLGCYGYERIETPHIDRLAAEGVLYERCYTPVPITLPSHLSILTGTYPAYHGVRENAGFYVAPELTTLAEVLKREGYSTAAFVGAYPLDSQTGLDQGFDLYDDNYPSSLEEGKHPLLAGFFDERPAADVVLPALGWLDEQNGPFFLWAHFFDPHQPQIPPSPYRERYADSLYDGEIAAVDEAIGRLLARLEERGSLDRTLVVLTADHGEGLGDHGELTHALLLYSTTVRVPLIVRHPRGPAGVRVGAPVATVDILPTILGQLGLEAPEAVQGHPLPRSDGEGGPRRKILSETLYGALMHGWSPLDRLTVDDWMLVHGPVPRLYHLADDPGELRDLAGEEPERLAALRRLLVERKRQLAAGGVAAPCPGRSRGPRELDRAARPPPGDCGLPGDERGQAADRGRPAGAGGGGARARQAYRPDQPVPLAVSGDGLPAAGRRVVDARRARSPPRGRSGAPRRTPAPRRSLADRR